MPPSTSRRDTLVAIEKRMQEMWEKQQLFQADAPPVEEGDPPKFLVTFPYPYMNGRLHLGHCFSMTKSEFAARYWRMKGRRVLWPFGLHLTGTPIAACAQKLQHELRKYGNPPRFPEDDHVVADDSNGTAESDKKKALSAPPPPGQHKSKRGKVGPKTKPQFLIMRDMGLSDDEIAKFADVEHWLEYFPARAIEDLKRLGCHIDYRRSFITTKANPYYDRFIQWQFRNLRAAGYLNFGKRHCIYSPLDGQPTQDHDRAVGEGVGCQEYAVVKLRVQHVDQHAVFQPFLAMINDRDVVLPGATLRPETVVGQTNCWMSPNFKYKAYAVKDASRGVEEIFLMTARAARNMAFQGFTINGTTGAEVTPLFEIDGKQLIGLPLSAPLAPYSTIYTLPMETITESKGTGVVMSVPSDSPDDYINFTQLLNKPQFRAKLGIKDEWVVPFAMVPIIEVPNSELGRDAAKVACEQLKVNGPKDADLLEQAKHMVYQAGFYSGVMITGPFSGEKVSVAKVKTMKQMHDAGDSIRYFEPQQRVTSRSGDDCVVALCDQWYIEYGKEDWKAAVAEHLKSMECYFPSIRNGLEETLNWLSDWPCSRTFGLGTVLPCDATETMLIDSLSDSTIYMAYYAVAPFVHVAVDGSLCVSGQAPNRYGLTPAMFTDETWDFVMRGVGTPESVHAVNGLPTAVAEKMRREFSYWYPVDLRVSAKDLIPNHLTMFLYNHAAIWPTDRSRWPRSIYCNGHILVDQEKMAKSVGNFITMAQAIDTFGADATRLACADAGDSLDDANFVRDGADGFILKLTALIEQAEEFVRNASSYRSGDYNLFDQIFDNQINAAILATDEAYRTMSFRGALNSGLFGLTNAFSAYKGDESNNIHESLGRRYYTTLALLLMPLAPHVAEYLWMDVLGHSESIMHVPFPTATAPIDYQLVLTSRIIDTVARDVRSIAAKHAKKGGVEINEVHVYAARRYNDWQRRGLAELQAMYRENGSKFPADAMKQILATNDGWLPPAVNDAMAFLNFVVQNVEKYGPAALSESPDVDDMEVLQRVLPNLLRLTGVSHIVLHWNEDESASIPEHAVARSRARPGEPAIALPHRNRE